MSENLSKTMVLGYPIWREIGTDFAREIQPALVSCNFATGVALMQRVRSPMFVRSFPKKPVDRTGIDAILYIHRERSTMRHKSDFGPPIV